MQYTIKDAHGNVAAGDDQLDSMVTAYAEELGGHIEDENDQIVYTSQAKRERDEAAAE